MALKSYIITNKRNGKAITAKEDGSVVQETTNYSDSQLWSPEKLTGKVKVVNKATGKNLDLMYGGTESGTTLNTWDDVESDSQLWQFKTASKGYKKIFNASAEKPIDVVMLSDEDGAFVQIWDVIGGDNQEWKLEEYPAKKPAVKRAKKTAVKK
ncbi:MAG: RICIN domain-containing protein [Clostridia bacterium]